MTDERDLISFMQDPAAYPEQPGRVDLVQTHISWVFIGDEYVYKVKKPVNFGFLDFSTLEKRRFYVGEELRLNSRFSEGIYLDVVPISHTAAGFVLGDESNVVEYALRMKKISEDHMLYRLLDAGAVDEDLMRTVGGHVARSYEGIPSDEKSRSFGTLETIRHNVIENFDQTRKYVGGPVSAEDFDLLESWSRDFMDVGGALFARRLDEDRIKDCHGDLHLQHICVEADDVFIFDCIEFNERFRFQDVASDVAFLAMDLDYNDRPELAAAFVNAFVKASGDESLREVLIFYKVYRAYVRAKVTSFLLDDEGLGAEARERATATAARYYALAAGYVRHDH